MTERRIVERATVALIVDDLRVGGAQRQLVELAKGLDKSRFRALVVTLHAGQPLERELIHREGVELVCLHRGGKYDFAVTLPLVQLLRRRQVQVVMPFLTPATFFGLTAAAPAGGGVAAGGAVPDRGRRATAQGAGGASGAAGARGGGGVRGATRGRGAADRR